MNVLVNLLKQATQFCKLIVHQNLHDLEFGGRAIIFGPYFSVFSLKIGYRTKFQLERPNFDQFLAQIDQNRPKLK